MTSKTCTVLPSATAISVSIKCLHDVWDWGLFTSQPFIHQLYAPDSNLDVEG